MKPSFLQITVVSTLSATLALNAANAADTMAAASSGRSFPNAQVAQAARNGKPDTARSQAVEKRTTSPATLAPTGTTTGVAEAILAADAALGLSTSSLSTAFPSVETAPLNLSTTAALSAIADLPLPSSRVDLLSSPSLNLPPLDLAPLTLPPVDLTPLTGTIPLVFEQPLTTGIASLDEGFDTPTSVSLGGENILPFEVPLTNVSVTNLSEFERYVQQKTPYIQEIDLNDVVVRAVCRNLSIKLSDIDHLIANDEYVARQGIFDLRISGISQVIRTQTPSGTDTGGSSLSQFAGRGGTESGIGTDPDSVDTGTDNGNGTDGGTTVLPSGFDLGGGSGDSRTFQNSVTVGQLLPTGGLLELLFSTTRTERSSGDPMANSQIGLRATQPLLRNAGPLVTQSQIILAGFDTKITASQFRQRVMEEVAIAIQRYYDLIFAVSNVEVLRVALAQAEELLRVNRAKYEAGVLPELDVLQAQSNVALRQQDVIAAIQQIEAASDLLKTQLAAIDDPYFVSLRPADAPRIPEYPISECVFLDEAVAFRPEMEQAAYNIEKLGINVRVAWNQALPQVDLFGSYIPTGAARTTWGSLEETGRTRTEDWRFGIQFNYPLQNREARYRFHQAEKRVDQSFIQLQQIRNNVILDVRNAVRSVETNYANIGVGKAAVEYSRATVEAGFQRLAVGLATSTDVLQFQTELAQARIRLLSAVIDYNQAIVELERSKGTLLDSLGILVCDGEIYKAPQPSKKALGLSE